MDTANSFGSLDGSLRCHTLSSSSPLTNAFELKQLHLVSQKLDFLHNYKMFARIEYIIKGSLAQKLPIYERHPSKVKVK